MWGGGLPKLTHIQSFWPEHLNIKTNQLHLTSKPVSRQQQELIKMKSFPLSPPLVLYCPNDMLECQVGWKPVHLTGPTIATSYITLNILLLYIKGIVFTNNHLFTLMSLETCMTFLTGTPMELFRAEYSSYSFPYNESNW